MSRLILSVIGLSAALVFAPMSKSLAADGSHADFAVAPAVAEHHAAGSHARQAPDPAAGRDLRRSVKAALAKPLGEDAEEHASQARELLALHAKVTARESLTTSERERLLTRLRGRLARLAKSLARDLADVRANESKAATGSESAAGVSQSASASTSGLAQTPPPGAAGGASQTDAQSLIDLIQATIAPSSWDVNGGQGSIVYWQLGQALVVRQTSEVHEQLGGVVGRLRK